MIPYFPQPFWRVGPFTIHAFGVACSLALLLFYWLVLHRAPRHGMTKDRAGGMLVTVLLSGLLPGLLWTGGSGISATGAALGGLTGFALFPRRGPLRPALDLMSFAIAWAYVLARLGCFLAHDHPGRLSESWMAVQYPGGARFDLGLLYCVAALFTSVGAAMIERAISLPGTIFAWVATTVGAARLAVLPLGEPVLTDWIVAAGVTAAGIMAGIFFRQPASDS